jgi:hypothetical protein
MADDPEVVRRARKRNNTTGCTDINAKIVKLTSNPTLTSFKRVTSRGQKTHTPPIPDVGQHSVIQPVINYAPVTTLPQSSAPVQIISTKSAAGDNLEALTHKNSKEVGKLDQSLPEIPSRCTNKQLMEAIKDLTQSVNARINDVEQHVKERIDKLESSIETSLLGKLETIVADKVNEGIASMNSDMDNRMFETECEVMLLKKEKDNIVSELTELRIENRHVTDSLLNHQKYLEKLEASKRASNLIVSGLPEAELVIDRETFSTDEEKVAKVFLELGQEDIAVNKCERLGRTNAETSRLLRVELKNPQDRAQILQNTNLLKHKGESFKKIYVKKDVHPQIRKEYARLRSMEQEEKAKPENQGKDVAYDADTRTLRVNGVIVDRFKPLFL